MSDTPRTDAFWFERSRRPSDVAWLKYARLLERELAEARRALQFIADFDQWTYSNRETVRLMKLEAATVLGIHEGER